jgi:hypothetical protein
LELDETRYNQVHLSSMRLLLIGTIITVVTHLTGAALRDHESIKRELKTQLTVLLEDFPEKK